MSIEDDYEATIRAAIREAAAAIAFQYSGGDAASCAAGQAVFNNERRIADNVVWRLRPHYSHTRKAKTQRKVER